MPPENGGNGPAAERLLPKIAAVWHTAALVGLIVAVAVTGTLSDAGRRGPDIVAPAPGSPIVGRLLPSIVVDWLLVLYVSRIGQRRWVLRRLLGRGWGGAGRALADIGGAAAVAAMIFASELASSACAGGTTSASVAALLPRTPLERAAWVGFALSAGFGEEVVYRGYLQTQLAAFTRHPAMGVLGQAALFGIAHADQGALAAGRIALYGVVLGVLARARCSLWPGIVAHTAVDLASGLLAS